MDPISQTAFYCCGLRMQDALGRNPICNDTYAHLFMNDAGKLFFDRFRKFGGANASNLCRHCIIDDLLRKEIAADPDVLIIVLGAGFDTRGYRLSGGRWVEVDTPGLISYKNKRLPEAVCRNSLSRLTFDPVHGSLEECLGHVRTDDHVIIVIEGVLLYLEQETISRILKSLIALFPDHTLLCELMRRSFFRRYGRKFDAVMRSLGSSFKISSDTPEQPFLDLGYSMNTKVSLPGRAAELGLMWVPKILLKTIYKEILFGYSVFSFQTGHQRA